MYISILISISISISIYLSIYLPIDRSTDRSSISKYETLRSPASNWCQVFPEVWPREPPNKENMVSNLCGTKLHQRHGRWNYRNYVPPQKREVVTADARQHMHPSMPGWYLQSVDNSTVVTPHKGDVFYIIRYHSQSPKITMNSVKHCRTIHSQLFFSENVVNPPPSMVYQVEHL